MDKQKIKNTTKKPTKTKLIKECDKLTSLVVRSRGYCELKGLDSITCSNQLQCMHIVGRANKAMRFDPNNLLCGCSGHHSYYTMNPFQFNELIREHFKAKYLYLKINSTKVIKRSLQDYIELRDELKKELNEKQQ